MGARGQTSWSSAQVGTRSWPWVPVAIHQLHGLGKPFRFSELCFPQLTPRNLPVPISSNFVTGHSGHSDKCGGPQGACGTGIPVLLLQIRER